MMKRLNYFSIVLVAIAGLALTAAPAAADQGPGWDRRGGSYPNPRVDSGHRDIAFENGQSEGYGKGLDDARHNRRYDPVRHGRYRSADHGYDRWYGPRERYREAYRNGFRAGYDAGYRDGARYQPRRGWGIGFGWFWRP